MIGRGAILLPLQLLWVIATQAQVLDLATVTIPDSRTLHGVYRFFVEGGHKAEVVFENLRLVPDDSAIAPAAARLATYRGLHVVVMEETQFHRSVDLSAFCGPQEQFSVSFGAYANMTVKDEKSSMHMKLDDAGTHFVVIANCGKLNGLAIRGTVAVKHDWGYLSPLERGSGAFQIVAVGFYSLALIVWSAACYRFWGGLLNMHKGLLAVLLLGLLESILWISLCQVKNRSGLFPETLFLVAALASIYKLIVFFFSLTSSPSQRRYDTGSSLSFHLLCLTYMLFSFNFLTVESLRHAFDVHQTVVLMGGAPLLVIGAVLFFLSRRQLQQFLDIMQHETDDRPKVYRRLQGLIRAGSCLAFVVLLIRIFDPSLWGADMWWLHSCVADGFPTGLSAALIFATLYAAYPTTNMREHSYMPTQRGKSSKPAASSVGASTVNMPSDDDDEDEPSHNEEEEGFGLLRKNNKVAESTP